MKERTRYKVEWCSVLPSIPDCPGDADWDAAIYDKAFFDDKADAADFAKKLLLPGNLPVNICTISKQEVQIDQDILEHENRTVRVWVDIESAEIWDANDCIPDVQLDPIRNY